MTDYEKIEEIARKNNNVFKTKMIIEAGIRKEKIREMLESGLVEKLGHGLYSLSKEDVDEYFEFQQRCQKGIFSYGTSAYFWNLSDRVPNVLSCTVPSKIFFIFLTFVASVIAGFLRFLLFLVVFLVKIWRL